jgi:hypothetical protein
MDKNCPQQLHPTAKVKLVLNSIKWKHIAHNTTTPPAPHTGSTQYGRPTVKKRDNHWASQQDSTQSKILLL